MLTKLFEKLKNGTDRKSYNVIKLHIKDRIKYTTHKHRTSRVKMRWGVRGRIAETNCSWKLSAYC